MKKIFIYRFILFGYIGLIILSLPLLVLAQGTEKKDDDIMKGLDTTANTAKIPIKKTNIADLIGEIIQLILSFLGVIFLVLTIYGGFLWMTAAGNDEQVKNARSIITSAVIGLFLVLSAYAITWFVISKLAQTSGIKG